MEVSDCREARVKLPMTAQVDKSARRCKRTMGFVRCLHITLFIYNHDGNSLEYRNPGVISFDEKQSRWDVENTLSEQENGN